VSIDSSPPAQPPQLSPDGKWVWDGAQWRPVVTAEPVHAGVFPAFSGINVDAPDPAAQFSAPAAQFAAPADAPVQYQPPAPAVDYSYQRADEPVVPLWQQTKSTGINMFLYPIAGVAVLVMAMMVLNSIGFIRLPWVGASSSPASTRTAASPTPDWSGPDSAFADRFLNGTLTPAVVALEKTVPALDAHCDALSNNCFDALSATQQQVKNVIAVIKQGNFPNCVAPSVSQVLAGLVAMDKQLQVALTAFQDNSGDELATGVYRFRTYHRATLTYLSGVQQARKTCPAVVLPTWVP
jgi:hypothetical protein